MNKITTLFLLTLTLLTRNSFAESRALEFSDLQDQYVSEILNPERSAKKIASLAMKLTRHLQETLEEKSEYQFRIDRLTLRQGLQNELGIDFYHWLKLVEKDLIPFFLRKAARHWKDLPQETSGPFLYKQLEKMLSSVDSSTRFSGLEKIYYGGGGKPLRGVHYAYDGKISLALARSDHMIIPLAHELVHRLDPDLFKARFHLGDMRKEVSKKEFPLSPLNPDHWRYPHSLEWWAEFFFLQDYESHYKEIRPTLISCQIFMALLDRDLIENPHPEDLELFETVVSEEQNCAERVADLVKEFRPPLLRHFSHEEEHYSPVEAFRKSWLKRAGMIGLDNEIIELFPDPIKK